VHASQTAAFAALFLFLAMALPAQSRATIQCDALIGFNGLVREGSYAPVIVSVQNSGSRRNVEVTLNVAGGSSFRATLATRSQTRAVALAADATRRISFVIFVPRDPRTLTASVNEGGTVLVRQEVDLRPLVTTDRLVAAISSDASLDALAGLSDETVATRVTYPRIDDLPDSWAAYDGVRAVVVHDTYFRELRESQIEALNRWVVAGGSLVFTGGAAALQHEPAGFAGLLPVHVSGLVERDGLPSLAEIAGVARGPRGKAVLAVASTTSGVPVVSDGAIPLIVRRDLGKGKIWFFAFDPTLAPLSSWDGLLPLWRLALGAATDSVAGESALSLADDPWMKPLLASRTFPSAFVVAIFAGLYTLLILGLVVGRFAMRIGVRRRILLLMALPLFGCLGAWSIFNWIQFQPGPQSLDASRLWMRSGDGLAVVSERTAVVAASAGTARLRSECIDCTMDLAPRARGSVPTSVVQFSTTTDERAISGTVSLDRFTGAMLISSGVIPFPVTVQVSGIGQSLAVTATNGTAFALRDCFIWRDGKAFPLGDIPVGAGMLHVPIPDDLIPANPSDPIPGVTGNPTRTAIFATEAAGHESSGGTLIAWLDGSPLRVRLEGSPTSSERGPVALLMVDVAQ